MGEFLGLVGYEKGQNTDYAVRIDPTGRSPIKPYLLLDPEDDKGVDLEFLSEAVKRFEEDESVKPVFIAAVEELSRELSSMSIGDDYKPYVTVCLCSFTKAKNC